MAPLLNVSGFARGAPVASYYSIGQSLGTAYSGATVALGDSPAVGVTLAGITRTAGLLAGGPGGCAARQNVYQARRGGGR